MKVKHLLTTTFFATMMLLWSGVGWGQTYLIQEGFDEGTTTPPDGWTLTGLGTYTTTGNYGIASPSLKFDGTGDKVVTPPFSNPDELSFWIKGMGTDATSALLVEALIDGAWETVADIVSLPTSGTTKSYTLDVLTTQLRFTYTKSVGNLAFDDVLVTEFVADTEAPVPTFFPENSATGVAVDVNPTVTFDEPIYTSPAGDPVDNTNVENLLTFTDGTDPVAFSATIAGNVITVIPDAALANEQSYTLTVGIVQDELGNAMDAPASATFTTIAAALEVTYSVVGGNGTLAATVDATAINSGDLVDVGKDVIFTATPDPGYRVLEWKLNTVAVSENTTNTFTISDLQEASDVTVEFEVIPPSYAVTFSVVSGNGTLAAEVDAAAINSGDEIEEGKDVVFTATPDEGFRVKEWKLNTFAIAENTTNDFTITNLLEVSDVTVEFEAIPKYLVTLTVTDGTDPVDGAILAVDGNELVATNSSGVTTVELVDGTYAYDAYATGLFQKSGGFTVSGGVVSVPVELTSIITEEFDYPVGSLITNVGYDAHSGAGTNAITVTESSVLYPNYSSSGFGSEVTLVGTGEDVNKTFEPQTKDNIYVGLLVNVSSVGTTGDYFFHLGPESLGTIYRGRLFVKSEAETGQIAFGIAYSGTPVYSEFIYELNTTYLIAIKYEFIDGSGNDEVSIYVNPVLGDVEPVSGWLLNTDIPNEPTNIGSFALRQGSSSSANSVNAKIDGIRISKNWDKVFERAIGTDASLSTFTLGGQNVLGLEGIEVNNPVDDQGATLLVADLTDFVGIAAEPNDPYASVVISLNGSVVEETNYATQALVDGDIVIATVTAEDGVTIKNYKVTIEKLILTYPVTFSVVEVESQTNGTVTARVDEVAIASGDEVEEGKDVVFTATPDFGFRVKDWLVDDVSVSETSDTYTLSSLADATDVKVEFEPIPTYPITFNVDMAPAGAFTTAHIKGDADFGGYYTGLQELTESGAWYTVTLNLPDGTYEYKYYTNDIDGAESIAPSRSVTVDGEGKTINELWANTDAGAAINPTTRDYDLTNPTNVTTTIKWYAATDIATINDGAVDLTETDHYTLVSNTLTIKKEYLATKLTVEGQSVALDITFDTGDPVTFTVNAIETAIINAEIDPAAATFDKHNPTDLATEITWNDASVINKIEMGATELILDTDYTLDGTTLTFAQAYLAGLDPAEGDELVFTITFDVGNPATFTVTVLESAAIAPVTSTYDIQNPQDIAVEITWNDAASIDEIAYGATVLSSPADYTLEGNTLTILQEFFQGQSISHGDVVTLDFTFNAGADAALAVDVINSATIDPVAVNFDLWSPVNVETTIAWNGASSIESVSKGGDNLVADTDYQVAGDKLTILESYFEGAAVNDVFELVVTFDIGETATFTITVIDTEPSHATINPVAAEFDKYAPANVTTTVTWNDATEISSVKVGATELALTDDYTITDIDGATATLNILEGYFSEVAVGDVVFDITFDVGNPAALTVTVVDNSPVAYPITVATVVGGTADITTTPATEAFKDDEVTVTIANIEDGKEFQSIEVKGADEAVIPTTQVTEGAEYTFTMPEQEVTIMVTLADIPVPSEFVDFEIEGNWTEDVASSGLSSYGNHTYSDLGVTIQGTNVMRNADAAQDGFAGALGSFSMRIRNAAGAKALITVADGGVADFSLKVRRWDGSPIPDYTVKYSVDGGTTWVSLANINGDLLATSDWYTYSATINSEKTNILIEIANTGTTERIMIDNFDWDGYVDTTAPEPTFTPANGATDVLTTVNPTIDFNEPVFVSSGVAVDNSNVAGLITFAGSDAVPFSATISDNVISIVPNAELDFDTHYTLTIDALEDEAGNKMSAPASVTFTTLSASAPVVTLTSTYAGEVYYAGDDVQVTWTTENVANINVELWTPSASQWNTIADNIDATAESATVTLPADAVFAKEYKLRLKDSDSDTFSSESGQFTIRPVVTDILTIRGFDENIEFRFDGEAVVTFTRENRNQKYIQDGAAAVLIDDDLAVITSAYTIGDVVTGLVAKKTTYSGIIQVIPLADPGVPTKTADVIPFTRTVDAISTDDQSKLIKISDADFAETGNFSEYSNYIVTDPSASEITFRTGFSEVDYIDQQIPEGKLKSLVAIVGEYSGTPQITSRSLADFELYSNDASLSTFTLGGQSVLSLTGLKVNDPIADAGATLNVVDFTNFDGIEVATTNANATVEVKLNGTVVEAANLATQTLADGDVVLATVTAENESTVSYFKVTISDQPSNEANILSFSFAEQTGNAVIGDGIIEVEVDHNADITALVASFTLSNGATAKVNDVAQESGVTANDFTSPVTYVVTAQDGSTSKDWVVTVTQADEVKHTVTFSVVGGNGNVSAAVDNVDIASGDDVVAGSQVVFTADPATSYQVKEWALNGTPVADNTTNEFTIASLAANAEVTVEFEAIPQDTYSVTFSVADGMGNISAAVDGSDIVSGDDVVAGSQVVFTAEPAPNYQVKEWTLNGTPVADNITNEFTIASLAANAEVTVEFEAIPQDTYSVTFSVVGGNGNVSATVDNVDIASGDDVVAGSQVVFTAEPAPNYQVKEWTLNGTPVADNTTNEFVIASLDANAEVTVEFEAIPQDTYTVTFSVAEGMGNISAAVGSSDIVSGDDVVAGSQVVFTAEPAPNYQVKEWTLNGTPVADNTTNEFVIASLDVDITVTVEFEEVVTETYTVTFSVVEVDGATNGTLTAAVNEVELTSGDEVEEGSGVVFTATPNDGYKVKTWTLNGDPIADFIENSYTISELTIDVVITVEFEVITSVPTLSLSNVKAYPNPFTNTIKLDNSELVTRVVVTDMIGKQVMVIDLNGDNVINTSSLREGVYLIILENQNGQRVVRRMIKR
jgi:sulfur carrier protein ThiS